MQVVSFASYLTRGERSQDDWHAFKFVRAIKGKPFSGYGYVPVTGHNLRLTPQNADNAVRWFAKMAVKYVVDAGLGPRIVLVPVPHSTCVVGGDESPRTKRLADAMAERIPGRARVLDLLRWTEPKVPASQGGPRDPELLYPILAAQVSMSDYVRAIGATIIMVDDVKTSGATLRACAARLKKAKSLRVRYAICAGRTVHESPADAFAVVEEDLSDYRHTPPKGMPQAV